MFYKMILLAFLLPIAAFSQNHAEWTRLAGPIRGHWSDTTRQCWYLYEKPKGTATAAFPADDAQLAAWRRECQSIQTDTLVLTPRYTALRYTLRGNWQTPARDSFSFIVGACAMPFPLAGKKREAIFEQICAKKGDFMVWMGDNVYYLFGEWTRSEKMARLNIRYRKRDLIQRALENQPNYAVWDDHDYGPNNSNGYLKTKALSLDMFQKMWMNPSYGEADNPGVYTRFSYQNADFFLLDSRYYCDEKQEKMLGDRQLEWLKAGLRQSKATFKFVVSPTQVLTSNAPTTGEDWRDYTKEHQAFLSFLETEKIEGVLLISGDVHYGEWVTLPRSNAYTLHEFTSTPLTSFVNGKPTRNNPYLDRETLVTQTNFGRIVVTKDQCRFELWGRQGQLFWSRTVQADQVQY